MLEAWEKLTPTLSITERIVGVIPWDWKVIQLKCKGTGTRKKDFEQFDEVVCRLLNVEEGLDGSRIRKMLGLEDEMGKKVFRKMVKPLEETMVAGDDSWYGLTDKGKQYLTLGSRFAPYEKHFQLVLDRQVPENLLTHELLKYNAHPDGIASQQINPFETLLSWMGTSGKAREIIVAQTSDVHVPDKGFFLDEYQVVEVSYLKIPIRIAFIEDFGKDAHRMVALKEKAPELIPAISNLLDNAITEDVRTALEAEFVRIYAPEVVQQDKDDAQKADEAWLLEIAEAERRTADKKNEAERLKERALLLEERRSFNTLEFERELDRLVANCQNSMWIISPWVRRNAFEKREKQIKQMLSKGCKVFVCFSKPHRIGEDMLEMGMGEKLRLLSENHPGFYYAELPSFHEKIVFADMGNGKKFEYTGSFNVLSFSSENKVHIGRENMRKLKWGADSETNYQYFVQHFAAFQTELLEKKLGELIQEINWSEAKSIDELELTYPPLRERYKVLLKTFEMEVSAKVKGDFESLETKILENKKVIKVAKYNQLITQLKSLKSNQAADWNAIALKKHEIEKKWSDLQFPALVSEIESLLDFNLNRIQLLDFHTKVRAISGGIPLARKQQLEKELASLKIQTAKWEKELFGVLSAITQSIGYLKVIQEEVEKPKGIPAPRSIDKKKKNKKRRK